MAQLNRNAAGGGLVASNLAVTTVATSFVGSRQKRVSLTLRNNGSTDIFVGPAGVTVANGFPLRTGETYDFSEFLGALFAISATTGDLRYLEVF